jgi:hypothetical protein
MDVPALPSPTSRRDVLVIGVRRNRVVVYSRYPVFVCREKERNMEYISVKRIKGVI